MIHALSNTTRMRKTRTGVSSVTERDSRGKDSSNWHLLPSPIHSYGYQEQAPLSRKSWFVYIAWSVSLILLGSALSMFVLSKLQTGGTRNQPGQYSATTHENRYRSGSDAIGVTELDTKSDEIQPQRAQIPEQVESLHIDVDTNDDLQPFTVQDQAVRAVQVPILERAKEQAPILERAKEQAPILERAKEQAPILERAKEQPPILERAKEQPPILERAKEQPPILERAKDQALLNQSAECFMTLRNERVCVLAPFCVTLDPESMTTQPIAILDPKQGDALQVFRMGRFRQKKLVTNLDEKEDVIRRNFIEADFKEPVVFRSSHWFVDALKRPETYYVKTDDDNQVYLYANMNSKANDNIAHYGGRIMFISHLLQQSDLYHVSKDDTKAVFMHTTPSLAQLLATDSWHRLVAQTAVAPLPFATSPISDLATIKDTPGVHYGVSFPPKYDTMCFKKAMVPAFLKGRFFVSRDEFAVKQQAGAAGAAPATTPVAATGINTDIMPLEVSIEASMYRDRVAQLAFHETNAASYQRKMVMVGRQRSRTFDAQSHEKVISLLSSVCIAQGWQFEEIFFEGKTAKEQISLVRTAGIAVGIHGANLVNVMFMPQRSGLIEIFPYGFLHDMYEKGMNSGMAYTAITLTTAPPEPPMLAAYDGDIPKCINKNSRCKVYYRSDSRQLEATDADLVMLRDTATKMIQMIDAHE